MGDYILGYAQAAEFPLASALAASAAFPGGVSPLRLATAGYDWYSYESWEERKSIFTDRFAKWSTLHLADGGIYDNLGLEPLFDQAKGALKSDSGCNFVLVSDAGKPLGIKRADIFSRWTGFSMRTLDIIHSQARSLRIRQWALFLQANPGSGVLIDISMTPREAIRRAPSYGIKVPDRLLCESFLSDDECKAISNYPTTLSKPSKKDFNCIEALGHQLTKAQISLYASHLIV